MRQPSGDPSAVAPPVPIPNTEVKRCSPDDSASLGCAKVGRRQSYAPLLGNKEWGFFVCADRNRPARASTCINRLPSFPSNFPQLIWLFAGFHNESSTFLDAVGSTA